MQLLGGKPSSTRKQLSNWARLMAYWRSTVPLAMWGVQITLGNWKMGWLTGGDVAPITTAYNPPTNLAQYPAFVTLPTASQHVHFAIA